MASLLRVLTVAAAVVGSAAIEPPRPPHQPVGSGERLITFEEALSGSFGASSRGVSWIAGTDDGSYIYADAAVGLVIEDIVTGDSETFVPASALPEYWEYWIRPDLKKVLFATNYTKQYRYTYFADYQILDVASGELTPLVEDQAGDIQYAAFSPVGDAIAFVRGNNLYLNKGGEISQITTDGGPDLFHAVPDWVYEEEIFGTTSTLWFSPDGQFIAYLSFNETGVGTFTVPYYLAGQEVAPEYPEELDLRYPKVGSKNPTVSLTLLEVETEESTPVKLDAFPADELIIGEVAWLTAKHKSVAYRAFNRVQDQEKLIRVDLEDLSSTQIRERDGSDGWLEHNHAIKYVGAINGSCEAYYVDVSDESGWNHLYLHPVKGGEPIALTSGEWEVGAVLKVDQDRRLIYYTSTEHHSTERHVYSVSFSGKKTALVDDTVSAYFTASFSAGGGFYILTYQGPNVPYQELYAVNSTKPIRTITDNAALISRLEEYNLPNITYFELEHPDGYSFNVMQRLPANFDASKKYPVLFVPYGGPGAQEVHKRFQPINWRTYLASDPELEYILYTVDNRGTGFKGREFRNYVTKHLGRLEPIDQIWAAEQLIAEKSYIDADHVAIFGWSYGGFLAAKTVEADSGVFTAGLIGAPVSDWRFYDSMYTERFMKKLEDNADGYAETAVRKPDGFKNLAGKSWLGHGTGDDNVHYQNGAVLIRLLVDAGVSPQKFEWDAYTDNDHSIPSQIRTPTGRFLYKQLTEFLYKEKNRPAEADRHQWSKKSTDMRGVFHYEE
ncbi:dipeptidyl aminopeptidase B [Plectosphaerella cucumerina]|uniref:Probable dipeptidyl-aminopeptidase B n=1 Tax=Plectosphaerella cucumerina TaxID=40658 RepID=A0A8K0X7M0_9PEZI|nr:dipeptidyl aminopeptidase B [Plectosphaerella cucumerina]